MVMTLVILTFVVFVLLDRFVFSKRFSVEPAAERALSRAEALPAMAGLVPAGIYLQPTFTWSRLGGAGEVFVGVHPMLLGLAGEGCSFELRRVGEEVDRGDPLVGIARAGRHLTVRAPFAGRVEAVNLRMGGGAPWRGLQADDGGWLYRIRAEHVADAVSRWLSGERAAEWARRRYDELRAYLHDAAMHGHLGTVMADGGELPVGILGELDASVWAGLEDRFLSRTE